MFKKTSKKATYSVWAMYDGHEFTATKLSYHEAMKKAVEAEKFYNAENLLEMAIFDGENNLIYSYNY